MWIIDILRRDNTIITYTRLLTNVYVGKHINEPYAKTKNSVVQPNSIDQAHVAGITLVDGLHDGIFHRFTILM